MIPLRQKLLREKWLWAVCLAILVHVGFFFVFYLNVNKEEPAQVTNSRVNTVKPSVASDVGQDLPPLIAKTYTATNNTDTIEKIGSDDKTTTQLTHDKEPIIVSATDKTLSTQTLTEDSVSTSSKPVSTLEESLQRNANLSPQTDDISNSMPSNTVEARENIKARAGLLSIDIPTEPTHVKIDKAYLSAKSEVEDINDQLSAAINEVKKRNQQKIDETQQLRSGINSSKDENTTGMSEQADRNDSL
ncbi:hypothetical protein ACT3TH_07075 [Psychrobacter sp. AOP22-C1-C5]|uniref:hypothetical protein n=1 Tax=Psychrobacter sp. AOP22-C1-C5 TaxID=3457716 RepID=UPI004036A339